MRPASKHLLLIGFGLLPLWAAIALVVIGSYMPGAPHDYWNVAPWAIVAAIPASAITMVIAAAAIVIHNRTPGDGRRKAKVSTAWFFGLVALVAGAIGAAWMSHRAEERQSRVEQRDAVEFAKNHHAVARAAGAIRDARVSSRATDNSRLTIWVRGDRTVYAVVRGKRERGKLTFVLACVDDGSRSPQGTAGEPCR